MIFSSLNYEKIDVLGRLISNRRVCIACSSPGYRVSKKSINASMHMQENYYCKGSPKKKGLVMEFFRKAPPPAYYRGVTELVRHIWGGDPPYGRIP